MIMSTFPLEPPVKQVSWPQVALILGLTAALVGGVTILALNDKSVADIITVVALVVVPLLAALGVQFGNSVHQKLDKVQETANGRLTAVMEQNEKLQSQITALALSVAPPQEREK